MSEDDGAEDSSVDEQSLCFSEEMSTKDAKRARPDLDLLQGFGKVIVGSSHANKRSKRAPTLQIVGPRLPRRDKIVLTWADAPLQVQFYKNRINDDLACLNKLNRCLADENDVPASEYAITLVKPRAKDPNESVSSASSHQ